MAWTTRAHTDEEINAAGRVLIARQSKPDEVMKAIAIINNWRAAHAFPLNTMQMRLRGKANQVDRRNPPVAQRIKRLPAIESKLRRLKNVTLADMQDIAGCRAVVGTKVQVAKLNKVYQSGRIRHELERDNNYIDRPTPDGYRSLHLVYRYYSDRNQQYSGQRIEIQIRSRLQHAWATAVEAIDTFANQQLKINQATPEWTRFFALMGSCIARRERTPLVPGTPASKTKLAAELRDLAHSLNVQDRLLAIGATAQYIGHRTDEAFYYLIDLDIINRKLYISRFTRTQVDQAAIKLAELELQYRGRPDRDVLLASASSVQELRKMYPNYRADTGVFLQELRRVLG